MRDFMQYGAVGNGIADDTAAILAAAASGYPMTGSNRSFIVNGTLNLPQDLDWENAEFLQTSIGVTRTLSKSNVGGEWRLRNIKVNKNYTGGTTVGTAADSMAFHISDADYLEIENCEATGDGPGTSFNFAGCDKVRAKKLWAHDMRWTAPIDPGTEQLCGIRFQGCLDSIIEDSKVENLLGSIGGGPNLPQQSDGLTVGATSNLTVRDYVARFVQEAVDISGSGLNRDIWLLNCLAEDIYGIGFKWIHDNADSGAIGCRAYRCGWSGFHVGIGVSPGDLSGTDNLSLIGCKAFDSGSNGAFSLLETAGFTFKGASAGQVPIKNILVSNCSAIDRQVVKTMKHGFYSDAAANLVFLSNTLAEGATVASYTGFTNDATNSRKSV